MASDESAALTTIGSEAPDTPNWELARQWSLAWRTLKWGFSAVIVLGFLVVIGQGYLFFRIFADIHPAFGWVFAATLTAALAWLVGRPLMNFFGTP
ncbi:MAG: hypothetical protein AAF253_13365, partial [Pseudomonadota bacterium]